VGYTRSDRKLLSELAKKFAGIGVMKDPLILKNYILLRKNYIQKIQINMKTSSHTTKNFLGALVKSGIISILDLNERIIFSSYDISYAFSLCHRKLLDNEKRKLLNTVPFLMDSG